jgi:hypothetical protein
MVEVGEAQEQFYITNLYWSDQLMMSWIYARSVLTPWSDTQ